MNKISGLLFLLFIGLASGSVAQEKKGKAKKPSLVDFDANKDNTLSEDELNSYFFKTFEGDLVKADANKDGSISKEEIGQRIKTYLEDVKRIFKNRTAYTFDEINQIYPIKPKYGFAGILIRETVEELSPSVSAKGISKVKSALFSYTRDFSAGTNTWIAKGAIMRPWEIKPEKTYFAFSIDFNRVASKDTTKAANSLVPKIGYYFTFSDSNATVIKAHFVRLLANVATDFDLRSSQAGIEVEWEPVFKNVNGLGVYYLVNESIPLEYRLQAFLRTETGYVFSKGDKENLESSTYYLRSGGKLVIDFRLWERVLLSGGIRYLYGLSGVPRHNRYWTATGEYALGPNGNISIKVDYQKGNVPLTSEDINTLVVGFGVKF